jgi:hypothetical protein
VHGAIAGTHPTQNLGVLIIQTDRQTTCTASKRNLDLCSVCLGCTAHLFKE